MHWQDACATPRRNNWVCRRRVRDGVFSAGELAFAVTDLGTHATFLASEFPPTFTRFLRAHTQLRSKYRFAQEIQPASSATPAREP
jgi:hypothetical protein